MPRPNRKEANDKSEIAIDTAVEFYACANISGRRKSSVPSVIIQWM